MQLNFSCQLFSLRFTGFFKCGNVIFFFLKNKAVLFLTPMKLYVISKAYSILRKFDIFKRTHFMGTAWSHVGRIVKNMVSLSGVKEKLRNRKESIGNDKNLIYPSLDKEGILLQIGSVVLIYQREQ